jgi:signal transduction histidine kinase
MALLGAAIVGVAVQLARRQARKVSRPLEQLTTAARSLGDGDFTVRTARSGIEEADTLGEVLAATARRLGDLLQRERTFSADAARQLRTPLTALLLGLESALARPDADLRQALGGAVRRAEQLRQTVDDLLVLAGHAQHRRGAVRTDVAGQGAGSLAGAIRRGRATTDGRLGN